MKYYFPSNYGENCALVPIDKSLIPLIAGALRSFEHRHTWQTAEDYDLGYNAFAQVQIDMARNCLTELIEGQNRVYRLLDTALNGASYVASGDTDPLTGLPIIYPAIPAAPPAEVTPAVRANLEAIRLLIEASGANTDEVEVLIGQVLLALA